jgi:hypothetical protein
MHLAVGGSLVAYEDHEVFWLTSASSPTWLLQWGRPQFLLFNHIPMEIFEHSHFITKRK